MAAPKGNQYWKLRNSHGRSKLFATPEPLWETTCGYFEYCDSHPWKTIKTKTKGQKTETEETVTQYPYTLGGLMSFMNVSRSYWRKFRASANEDYFTIITRIENIIQTQQLEGALVGAFNPNIVARVLGLANKRTVDHTSTGYEFEGFNFIIRNSEADTLNS